MYYWFLAKFAKLVCILSDSVVGGLLAGRTDGDERRRSKKFSMIFVSSYKKVVRQLIYTYIYVLLLFKINKVADATIVAVESAKKF